MKFRFLPVAAAAVLLAACASSSDETAGGAVQPTGETNVTTTQGLAPGSLEEFQTVVGDRVFFALDQYTLSSEAQATLRKQAVWLKQNDNRTLILEGHGDERGTREYNLALGERRANAMKNFLVAQGVNGSRLRVISYGKERPVCGESTEACWSKNRRGVSIPQ